MCAQRTSRLLVSISAIVWLLPAAVAAQGQPLPDSKTVSTQDVPTPISLRAAVSAERKRTAQEIDKTRAAIDAAKNNNTEPPASLTAVLELLTNIELSCAQVITALEQQDELNASNAQVTADLETLRAQGLSEAKPYPFMMLETLHDQLTAENQRFDGLTESVRMAQTALDAAKTSNDEKQRLRRQAKEEADTNQDDARAATLRHALRLTELACRIASQKVSLRQLELSNQRLDSETHELRVTLLRENIAIVKTNVRFSSAELQEILAQLDQQDYRLARSIEEAEADFPLRNDQWHTARAKMDAAPSAPPALAEEVEARRLARLARQRELGLLGQQQQVVADLRTLWLRRHEAHGQHINRDSLSEREKDAREIIDQLERDIRLHAARLDEVRNEARTIDSKLDSIRQQAPDAARWVEEQREQIGALIRIFEDTVAREQNAHRLYVRYLAEIGAQADIVTWAQRLQGAWRVVVDVWHYELTYVQDNPITVKKIVTGALLLILGALGARVVSRLFTQRFLPRFGLNEGALAAIQSLLFYVLLLTVVMLSLRIVNVPLTAFTILGGALAIGIGFGSQNIVNNFISGLILLAERPIRVGDLIEIEDLIGTVAHIGPRSTRVCAPQNMDIVVPNSSFLEKNVVNWTLSDDQHRAHITLGVIYGSPTREVGKLIRRALDEHGKILPKPEPTILFADFGDNALMFEVHFWIRMRRIMERRIIESDVRYRIDALFREAGIVIAFPQRDVHLDTARPLTVHLVQDEQHLQQDGLNDDKPAEQGSDVVVE